MEGRERSQWRRGGQEWSPGGSIDQSSQIPHYFDEDLDPHRSERVDPDPRDAYPQPCTNSERDKRNAGSFKAELKASQSTLKIISFYIATSRDSSVGRALD
jgi:hypothetical protein